jgi:hypothetical protein
VGKYAPGEEGGYVCVCVCLSVCLSACVCVFVLVCVVFMLASNAQYRDACNLILFFSRAPASGCSLSLASALSLGVPSLSLALSCQGETCHKTDRTLERLYDKGQLCHKLSRPSWLCTVSPNYWLVQS